MNQDSEDAKLNSIPVEDVGQALLVLCGQYGLKHLFLTGGTDLAPIQDALVKFDIEASGKPNLIPINVPHETVSTGMAIGYAMFTGRPAAVAVHVHVGTANALGNVMNAAKSRVPMILLAGRTPYTESGHEGSRDYWIHWGQDIYDPSGVLREFVKWEYEITRKENLAEVIARAFRISRSDPPGPVYLTFGREILMDKINSISIPPLKLSSPVEPVTISEEQVEEVAKLILQAQNPLIICGSLGRNTNAVKKLVSLCKRFGIAVSENVRTYMNYPTTDEMHVGFNTNELVNEADIVLVLDCIVPWIPSKSKLKDGATVILVDQDPSFRETPMWSFPVDMAFRADSYSFVKQLEKVLIRKYDSAGSVERLLVETRKAVIAEKHKVWKQESQKRALARAEDKPIDMEWLSYVLNQKLKQESDFLLVNEYSLSQDQVEITKPGTLFGQVASGYLGRGRSSSGN